MLEYDYSPLLERGKKLKHKLKSKLLNLSSIDEEIDNLNQKTDHATTVLYGLESYDDVVAS